VAATSQAEREQPDYSRKRPDYTAQTIQRAARIARSAGFSVVEDGLIEILEVYGQAGLDVIAMFAPETQTIYLNEDHEHWVDPAAYVRKRYRRRPRWFSTRSADHIIRHEIGHARHWGRFDPSEVDLYWHGLFNEKERAFIGEMVSRFFIHVHGRFHRRGLRGFARPSDLSS
jgi:hypothetical protein